MLHLENHIGANKLESQSKSRQLCLEEQSMLSMKTKNDIVYYDNYLLVSLP